MDNHGVVSLDAKDADLQQSAIVRGTDTHREVVIESPLGYAVAGGTKHVLVSDVVLPSCLRDTHHLARYLVKRPLSRNPARSGALA
jgi:hypothetical protein